MRFSGIDFDSVFKIFLLDFETVLTVWYIYVCGIFFVFLDFGIVLTVWYVFVFLDFGIVLTVLYVFVFLDFGIVDSVVCFCFSRF